MAATTWSTTDKTANTTLGGTNNLTLTFTANGGQAVRTIDRQIAGKFYFECTFTTITSTMSFGIASQANPISGFNPGSVNAAYAAYVNSAGSYNVNGSTGIATGAFSNGGVACVALDLGAQLIWFRNGAAGNWNNNAANSPATGVGGLAIPWVGGGIPAYGLGCVTNAMTTGSMTANFGDSAFTGAVPAGFTSGFTAGAVIPINEVATQIAAEQWSAGTPAMQPTQILVEQWAEVNTSNPQFILTQALIEQWASVAQAASATTTTPALVVVLA